jgi:hypothetical protein
MVLRSLHRRLAPWLILLLLVAQGLRVCIPGADGHDHHESAIHLESLLTAAADQHESEHDGDGDTDLTLSVLVKLFSLFLAAGLVPVLTSLFVPCLASPGYRPDERCFRPPRGSGFTPPLRAPPR